MILRFNDICTVQFFPGPFEKVVHKKKKKNQGCIEFQIPPSSKGGGRISSLCGRLSSGKEWGGEKEGIRKKKERERGRKGYISMRIRILYPH